VLFLSRLGRYALAFGTGDRGNLWSAVATPGRFYLIVDEGLSASSPGLPLTEDLYHLIEVGNDNLPPGVNLLLDPTGGSGSERGWFMLLDPDERVITKAFGVGGILIFSSFQPVVLVGEEGQGNDAEVFCSLTGHSRNFVVFTANGNAVADLDENAATGLPATGGGGPGPGGGPPGTPAGVERALRLDDFVSSPFVEQAHTQNVTGDDETPPPDEGADADCTNNERLVQIGAALRWMGPTNARYGNYSLRLGQRMSKRGILYPACVPIGVVQRNWREN
jgi:hypothetical protein